MTLEKRPSHVKLHHFHKKLSRDQLSRIYVQGSNASDMTGIISIPSFFLNISNGTEIPMIDSMNESSMMEDVVMIVSTVIASIGIVANFTVIIVFLNDKKLRKKIPNIFIIHQVG